MNLTRRQREVLDFVEARSARGEAPPSYREIGDITCTSEGALKASYHIAVEKIKKLIL